MREQELYIEAMMRSDPQDRRSFLDDACRDDDALRERLEKLLCHAEDVGSFLESPPPAFERPASGPRTTETPPTATPDAVTAGTLIGSYKLLEQIGEGGFGVVFMAEQTAPVKRRVALKVIKPGITSLPFDSASARQVVARFEAERQALAMMDHPNIARVLDAGATEDGRPYFVMELVNGIPITDFCDGAQLTPKERLELFVTVCQAVQHAHQKGIIHRDIKPTNVLVTLHDDRPVVKVIDFGIAKATGEQLTEKTLFTGFAQLLGTPLYMSPEQAAMSGLDIDTRSDIYSLGVLLYELLTGTTPFDRAHLQQAAFDEVRRIIREEEPQKPSTRLSDLGSGRPPSGEDRGAGRSGASPLTLAAIAALRRTEPRKLSQLVKGELDWIVMKALEKDRGRRYETASGLAADVARYLAGEAVSACPPSAAYRLRKLSRRHRKSLVVAALAGALLLVVAGSLGWWARDEAARHGRNAEAVAALLERCEEALRSGRAEQAALALDATERRTAEGGAELLSDRLKRCRDDLALLRELNAVDAYSWSCSGGAFPEYAESAGRLPAPLTAYGVTPDTRRVEGSVERVNESLIRDRVLTALDLWLTWEGSADVRADLRALLRTVDADPYRDAFRDALVAQDAEAVVALSESDEALVQPARFAILFAQFAGIPSERKQAVLESALRSRPGDLGLLMQLGDLAEGRPEAISEQLRWYQAAVSAHPENAVARSNLGVVLSRRGDLDGAISCYLEAIRLDPTFPKAHFNLGESLAAKGDPRAALASFEEAIRQDPTDANAHHRRGMMLSTLGDLDGALEAHRSVLRLDPSHLDAHLSLGAILCDEKHDFDGAIATFEEAIRFHPRSAVAHVNLGNALHGKGDFTGAVSRYREAIEIDPRYANAHVNLGVTLGNLGDQEGRVAAYREAVRISPEISVAHDYLGAALMDLGDVQAAISEMRIALELDPTNLTTRWNLGNALQRTGDVAAVLELVAGTVEIAPEDPGAHNNLAWLLATGPDGVRDGARAVTHATRACELSAWSDPGAIDTLAAAHAEAGEFDAAVARQRQALGFPDFAAADGEGARNRLELYAARKAFRDPSFAEGKPDGSAEGH